MEDCVGELEKGSAMEEAVDLSIQEEIPSGPEAGLEGRLEMKERMSFSEHKSSLE